MQQVAVSSPVIPPSLHPSLPCSLLSSLSWQLIYLLASAFIAIPTSQNAAATTDHNPNRLLLNPNHNPITYPNPTNHNIQPNFALLVPNNVLFCNWKQTYCKWHQILTMWIMSYLLNADSSHHHRVIKWWIHKWVLPGVHKKQTCVFIQSTHTCVFIWSTPVYSYKAHTPARSYIAHLCIHTKHTCGKVANLLNPSMEQNSWRLTDDVMMSRHIVNSTRLPSFFPGPKI